MPTLKQILSILGAVAALTIQPLCGADLERDAIKPIVPERYTFNRETLKHPQETDKKPVYTDPRLAKLTDGMKDASARRVVWRSKGWESGRVLDLDFTFAQPVDLRRIVVHSLRRRGYAVERIQVFGRAGDDEALVGDVTFKQSWAYPPREDLPPTKMMALEVPCEPTVVSEARVRVHLVSYLGLSEIEFFGIPKQAPPPPATAAYRVPPTTKEAPFRVLAGDFNDDGQPDFLLENASVAYVVDLRWGGVVNMALNKRTGVNLVKPNSKGTWGGLFADRMYPTGRNNFFGQAYTGKIVENTPGKLAVRVQGHGKSGQFLHITFEKTYSLRPDGPALRVDYRVLNGQDNVVAVDHGVWALNGMGSTQEATRVFWADEGGARELRNLDTQHIYEPRRGWLGMRTESGSGIVMLCEFRRTAGFLLWRSGDFATIEFKMGRYSIEAGGSLTMTAWAVPFDGIGTPHGASPAMVGSIDLKPTIDTAPESLAFHLKPNRPGTFEIVVESRRLPSLEWELQHEAQATLDIAPIRMTAPLRLGKPGTYVFRVGARQADREVFTMERPVVVGTASGTYAMAPECERFLPETADDTRGRIDYHSLAYQTEHVPWATKWAGGKPRILFLPRRRAGIRQAVELAQRFEMELHTSYLPRSMDAGCLYDLSDFAGRLNAPQLLKALQKTLTKQQFDAIVIPGDLWKDLTPTLQKLILDKVRAGTGLVLLAPEYVPDELDQLVELTVPEAKARRFRGKWEKTADHFITDGVPFSALPEALALPYRATGEQLATVGDQPLVAVSKLGAGRVAIGTWVVAGLKRNQYHQTYGGLGILPNMPALGSDFASDCHYWEYQMSLLMRMVYWAARKESLVRGTLSLDPLSAGGSGQAVLRLRSALDDTDKASVKWTLRDRFSRVIDSGTVKDVTLPPQESKIPIAFRNAVLEGPVYLEAIVLTDHGTVWWGTVVGQVAARVRIEEVVLAKRVWRRDESLVCNIRLSHALSDCQVVVEAIDGYGRVFARQDVQVGPNIDCRLPLDDCLGLTGHVVVRLLQARRVVSEKRRPFVVHHVADTTRMQVAFGWPGVSYEGHPRFVQKHYYRRLKHLGATSLRVQHVRPFEWFEARSIGLSTLKSGAGAGIGGKHPDTRNPDKGKLGLVRKPCLSAPAFRENLVTANAQATAYEDAGVIYRGMGDELNSIPNWDGCFTKDCQKQFRAWLQERYGSLAALNQEWATAHTSWARIVPMTLEEAQAHASLAPWVDHRLFNNWNWAHAMARVLEGTRRSNPDIRLGFSGTQETKPWNAYDWWQICQSVSAVAAYSGEQAVQRRSFSDDMYSMTWIGYTSSFEQLSERVLSCLFEGDGGFNVFSGRYMIDPDYTIPERGTWLRKAFATVDGGRAEVIMNSRYDTPPIAFHYSPASVCVDQALGTNALRVSETAGTRKLLLNRSADYEYAAYAQLEAGKVVSRDGIKRRLLILPASAAMSDRECETVRRWVDEGGVVVGSLGTATYTSHGRPRGKGALDDVFGIHRSTSRVQSEDARIVASGSAHGVVFDGFEMPVENIELGLSADGARVLGFGVWGKRQCPAVFVNRHGSGVAVYLAADVASTYGVWGATRHMASRAAAAKGMDRFIASLLALARIAPRPIPMTESGQRLACTRTIFRRNGSMRLLGILRNSREAQDLDPKTHPVTLQFEQPFHVYDLVTRKYGGQTDVYRDTFTPTTHRALVLLPYEVKGVRLEIMGKQRVARGESISLRVRLLAASEDLAEHRLQVEVFGADGVRQEGYENLVVLHDGTADLRLPIALNAIPGDWRIAVTDAISAWGATIHFTVAR